MMRDTAIELNFSFSDGLSSTALPRQHAGDRTTNSAKGWTASVWAAPPPWTSDLQLSGIGPHLVKQILIIVVALAAVLYAADYVSLRLRVPAREPLGSITVHTYYSVKLKNGKTEFDYVGDHQVSCSNSLLPQQGLNPCWYASRHTEEQIKIDSGDPNNPHLF